MSMNRGLNERGTRAETLIKRVSKFSSTHCVDASTGEDLILEAMFVNQLISVGK